MSGLLALFEEVYGLVQAGATVEEAVATTVQGTQLEQDQSYLTDQAKQFVEGKRKSEDDNNDTPQKKHKGSSFVTPDKPAVNVPTISPDEKQSVSNLPPSTDMTEANPTRRINSGQVSFKTSDPRNANAETEVSNIPLYASLSTPWPDTLQAVMPYYLFTTGGSVPSGTTGNINILSLRLNSPYDVYLDTSLTYTADATPVASAPSADAPEATINAAMWYNYYKQYYNYYTVVATDVTVRFRNTTNTKKGELAVYRFIHGRETPRYYETGSTAIHHRYKRLHPNMSFKFCAGNQEVTETTAAGYKHEEVYDNWVEFSNMIKPGDVHHEVVEDELLEVWSLFDKVPATPEYMTFHIQRSPRSSDTTMTYDTEIDIKYYVQFKDLKNSYRYITGGQDGPTLTDMAIQDD